MTWWQYLLLVNLYLVLFYGFYALLLRRETFFQLNRIYLVSAALLSFFIPLIQAGWVKNLFITQRVEYTIYSNPVIIHGLKPAADVSVNFGQLFAYFYLAGVAFLVLRLVWQLVSLNKIIKRPGQNAAYSFFKKIKLDEQADNNDIIHAHEEVHAKQWHSADVLVIEMVMIINWFNPVVYFYRRAIKHIHEFIADSHAIKTATSKADYALLLLTQTFNPQQHQLVNHFFNNSLLKQRIIMLQKNRSQRIKLLKYGLSAPLFILMMILSSATVNNSKAVDMINTKAAQVFATPAVQEIRLDPPAVVPNDGALTAGSANNNLVQKCNIGINVVDTLKANNALVFASVEQEPQFKGGPGKFNEFLAANVKYPQSMRDNGTQGKVIATFIVESDGSITDVKALRAPSPDAGLEVVRAVKLSSGKWAPGIQNNHPVRVQYTISFVFSLADSKTDDVSLKQGDTSKTPKTIVAITGTKPGTEPLYVLDGKVIKAGDFKSIDPNEIESISVLKNESTAVIYGKAGANGVIVIATKKKTNDTDKTPEQKKGE